LSPLTLVTKVNQFLSAKGRISRKQYLISCIAFLAASLLIGSVSDSHILTPFIFILYICFLIQTIRRLHDFNRSGWWALLVLVPLVNIFMGLLVMSKKGTLKNNKYLC
jgi:uncharacterized membrane protein YhaH (DUF805 family)